jgi:multidrug resistance efflux pump
MSHITGLQQLLESIKGAISNWEASFVISAPINGMLVYAPKLANKQMVSPSNAIMTIVPVQEKGATMIRCNAPGNGIGKIKVGTPINLALDAYPQKEFGALNTVVKKISVVPSTDQSGQTTYEITAALPDTLITTYQKEIPLRQNMTGVATFITKDRSILERIFDSLLDFTKK